MVSMTSAHVDSVETLNALIRRNGVSVEDAAVSAMAGCIRAGTKSEQFFEANQVYADATGFEVWVGSLEDALNLKALKDRGINAFLNAAHEECSNDCSSFCGRSSEQSSAGPPRRMGRQRSHARGLSLNSEDVADGSRGDLTSLHFTEIRSLVSFDEVWYSRALGCEVTYLGIDATDVEGYDMRDHFADAAEFLNCCREEGRKVFVHCVMGVNRSVTCVVAFLCQCLGMPLREAVDIVSQNRGFVLSNASFMQQLIDEFGSESATASSNSKESPSAVSVTEHEPCMPRALVSAH